MTIQLPPSLPNDFEALTQAIKDATRTNQDLVLLPGLHFTKPGFGPSTVIPIGPNGLTLSGTEAAIIQRPNCAIKAPHQDDNYGIFLSPTPPEDGELPDQVHWQVYHPAHEKPFEYTILIRGNIKLSGVTLDCNMGNQNLEGLPKEKYEHSAMLAVAGTKHRYHGPLGPGPLPGGRFVFVGFKEVQLDNLRLRRGGFADDILFPTGYFRPNIEQVKLSHLTSEGRVNHKRASVDFTGLSQRISISDCDLDSLHCEVRSNWSADPGPVLFEESTWIVNRVKARAMSFAANGPVLTIKASHLGATETFQIHGAAGLIVDSGLAVSIEDRRFFSLRDFHFDRCTWVQKPDSHHRVYGITLRAEREAPFSANFVDNSFLVNGQLDAQLIHGQLITTDKGKPGNHVTARFTRCKYHPKFGTEEYGKTRIASLREVGEYSFTEADLAGRDLELAIVTSPVGRVITFNGLISVEVPLH